MLFGSIYEDLYVCAAGIRIGGLEAFEDGGFDLRNDLSSLTEKGIDALRTDLAALDIECAEELRKAVHANYIPFITASQVTCQTRKHFLSSMPPRVHIGMRSGLLCRV